MNDFDRWKSDRATGRTPATTPRVTEAGADLATMIRDELGRTIREDWWRRGGTHLETAIAAVPGGGLAPWLPQPLNAADLRAALVAGTLDGSERWAYHPVRPLVARQTALAALLTTLATSDHPLAVPATTLLSDAFHDADWSARGVAGAVSNADVEAWSRDRWGVPTEETLGEAWHVVRSARPPASETAIAGLSPTRLLGPDVIATVLAEVMRQVAPQWRVVIATITPLVSCRQASTTVTVSDRAQVDAQQLRRLVAHEIGGHVLRGRNAYAQRGLLAALPLGAQAAATEEGVALHVEQLLGVVDERQIAEYAARTVAVSMARMAGIADVHRALAPYLGTWEAAAVAVRVKRGVPAMHEPGAFMKDHVYFSGGRDVARLLGASPALWPRLMATKWSAELLLGHPDLVTPSDPVVALPDADLLARCDDALARTLRPQGQGHV